MTTQSKTPTFRDLLRSESIDLLARNNIGRLAFSFHDSVDIRPIHYVYEDGWIFGRTAPGQKLETLRHNQWVVFEVDEISGMFDWVSIIARGSFFPTDPGGSEQQARFHERAMNAIRKLNPQAFTDADQTWFRTEVFAIHVDSLTGKSCTTED